jgi:hypothetical protein
MSMSLLPHDEVPPDCLEAIWRLLPLLAGVDPAGETIGRVLHLMNAHLALLGRRERLAPLPDVDLTRIVPVKCFAINLQVTRETGETVFAIDMRGSPHYPPEPVATLEMSPQ